MNSLSSQCYQSLSILYLIVRCHIIRISDFGDIFHKKKLFFRYRIVIMRFMRGADAIYWNRWGTPAKNFDFEGQIPNHHYSGGGYVD